VALEIAKLIHVMAVAGVANPILKELFVLVLLARLGLLAGETGLAGGGFNIFNASKPLGVFVDLISDRSVMLGSIDARCVGADHVDEISRIGIRPLDSFVPSRRKPARE
jgi:hypothetical protein